MARKHKKTLASNALFDSAVDFHQRGDLQKAEHLYRQILGQEPEHADALHMLGLLAAQAGHGFDGAKLMRQAIAIEPNNPDFHNNLGMACLDQKQLDDAIQHFTGAVALRPAFPEAHFNLGNALRAQGRTLDAIGAYQTALKHRPNFPDALQNLGAALVETEQYDAAVPVLEELVTRFPKRKTRARHLLGACYLNQSRVHSAIPTLERHLEQFPDDTAAMLLLGDCYGKIGAFGRAESVLLRACELLPESASARYALALARQLGGRSDQAMSDLEQLLALDPDHPGAWNLRGMIHQISGDLEAARKAFRKCLELQPDHAGAIKNLSDSDKFKSGGEELIARIRTRLEEADVPVLDRISLNFALGKIMDDRGDYDAAFAAFAAANAAKRRIAGYDAVDQQSEMKRLTDTFSKAFFDSGIAVGHASDRPIFVVGMPRSGTSLVEQILASHGRVAGAGELTYFTGRTRTLGQQLGLEKPYPECAAELTAEHLQELGDAYLDELAKANKTADFVVDKMPYNFLHLGLIHMVFPRARIIHCRRDPMDTCLSIFMRDFVGMHSYSYDLNDIAAAYRHYEAVMAHWAAVLPIPIVEVDYDALVADQEPQTRRLLDQVGLDWDPACLSFHKTDRQVRTASFWQVRQPMYKSASARWKNYEQHLGQLRTGLERGLERGA